MTRCARLCRIFVAFWLVLLPAGGLSAQTPDPAKLDPLLRRLASPEPLMLTVPGGDPVPVDLDIRVAAGLAVRQDPGFGREVRAILVGDVSEATLSALGVTVTSRVEDIISAWVPVDALASLTQRADIRFIHASTESQLNGSAPPLMDRARPETHAWHVHRLTGLAGQGTIVGVLDSGIDWAHPDFRRPDGTTRIKFLWDMSDPAGPPPPGFSGSGGSYYTEAQINQALATGLGVRQVDTNGHGTHVAGSAAGNGTGTNGVIPAGTYVGVAPLADLIIVKGFRSGESFQTADIIDAIAFIDSNARALGRPYALNMSLGGQLGAHDGTSADERVIDLITGPARPGGVIVIAAGNEGDDDIHFSGPVSPALQSRRLMIGPYAARPGAGNDFALVNGWYTGSSMASVSVRTPNGQVIGPIPPGGSVAFGAAEGGVIIENAVGGADPFNGDRNVFIQLTDYTLQGIVINVQPGEWRVQFSGNAGGQFHGWIFAASIPAWIHAADLDFSTQIGIPGTARNATTVGSYTTRTTWVDINGQNQTRTGTIGAISAFSNPGPTRDGRLKPEITAPGEWIASTRSSVAQRPTNLFLADARHMMLTGTSMATPQVTGTAAIMLQVLPQLNAIEVRQRLTFGARRDQFTGSAVNNLFGYGKLDVLEALRAGLLVGDVNLDNSLDVGDAVSVVAIILGRIVPNLAQVLAAEIVVDGVLNVADVVGVTLRILGVQPSIATTGSGEPGAPRASVGLVPAEPAGVALSIPVTIDAPVALAGVQLEIDYGGSGLRLGAPRLAEGARGLTLDYVDDGSKLTIIAYGLGLDGPPAGRANLLYLPVLGTSPGSGSTTAAAAPSLPRITQAILVDRNGRIVPMSESVLAPPTTQAVRVSQNRPNPLSATTGTRFELVIPAADGQDPGPALAVDVAANLVPGGGASAQPVSVNVYNVRGQLVRRLYQGSLPPGRFLFEWDARGESGSSLTAGLYFAEISVGAVRETLRMILVEN